MRLWVASCVHFVFSSWESCEYVWCSGLSVLLYAMMFALLIYICCVCLHVRTVLEAVWDLYKSFSVRQFSVCFVGTLLGIPSRSSWERTWLVRFISLEGFCKLAIKRVSSSDRFRVIAIKAIFYHYTGFVKQRSKLSITESRRASTCCLGQRLG